MYATGFRSPSKGVLFSLGPIEDKYALVEEVRAIGEELGLPIFATEGTAEALERIGIACQRTSKHLIEGAIAMSLFTEGRIDLGVNIPREYDRLGLPDGYLIRRRAVEAGIPLITDLQSARAIIAALRALSGSTAKVLAWQDYIARDARPLQR